MPLDRAAQNLRALMDEARTTLFGTAPRGGQAGQSISIRAGGRSLKALCLTSISPGPVVAVLTPSGWGILPSNATRQVGQRQVDFRQSRVTDRSGEPQILLLFMVDKTPEFEVWLGGSSIEPFKVQTISNMGVLNGVTGPADFITREVFGLPRTHPGETGNTATIKQIESASRIFFRGLLSATSELNYFITLLTDGNEIDSNGTPINTAELYPQVARVHYITSSASQIFNFSGSLALDPNPADADVIEASFSDWRKNNIETVFDILGKTNPIGSSGFGGLNQNIDRIGNRVFTFQYQESEILAGPGVVSIRESGVEVASRNIDITSAFLGDVSINPFEDVLICCFSYFEN